MASTADLNFLKGYSILYDILLSNKSSGKRRKKGVEVHGSWHLSSQATIMCAGAMLPTE